MKLLVVVDMQKDFVDGSLGTKEAISIVNNVNDKINSFDGIVVFTRDSHSSNYLNTQEGKNLPILHCQVDTEGWQVVVNTDIKNKPSSLGIKNFKDFYDKDGFGSFELVNDIKKAFENKIIESVEFVGLCTDICVATNVFMTKGLVREIPIIVDSSCCAGVTVEKHLAAIETMKSCQINVI